MIASNLERVHEHYVMGLSEEMGALNSTVKIWLLRKLRPPKTKT